jgi:hypothetical protein
MTHPTKQRTYDQETWNRARAAWDAGRFGSEWADCRGQAAKAGIIFPPDGTPDDTWSDASPSQRALVIRAIRETPRLLRRAIGANGVRSWSDVIERLLLGRDLRLERVEDREIEWATTKARRGSMTPIGETLRIVSDSLDVPS